MGTKNNISFAVGSKYGPRSSNWIVSISGYDVYVTTAKCKKLWKVSLHKSGRWHLKSLKEYSPTLKGPLIKTHKNDIPKGNYAVGLHIIIPDSSLRPASNPERTSVPEHWIDRPVEGGLVEISVMRWNYGGIDEEWPGQSVGTQLKFPYILCKEKMEVIGIISRHLPKAHPESININSYVDNFTNNYKPIVLDSPERRGYFCGLNKVGSIVITEYAID
ncbi:hypothetical protein [uncultured Paraglaciecola sp.]|uniref:hypothetical protein n=1 Tax=uncultured Paraglaciecola sp. TaxID=1765024 RepID=UPI00263761D9|nr:hypothetical protein [uncultured Paraglaciecola sp.]